MTAGIDRLPRNMRAKIVAESCPVAGLAGDCWAWTGALNSRGYGCVGINSKSQLSHRVAYQLLVGTIPADLQIDHLCRNKRCCNPSHLEAVSGIENYRRAMDVRGRPRCNHGHPLAGPNLVIRMRYGWEYRTCRMCQIIRMREDRARRSGGVRLRRAPAALALRDARLLADSERALAELTVDKVSA